jgi:hypothetical protein
MHVSLSRKPASVTSAIQCKTAKRCAGFVAAGFSLRQGRPQARRGAPLRDRRRLKRQVWPDLYDCLYSKEED